MGTFIRVNAVVLVLAVTGLVGTSGTPLSPADAPAPDVAGVAVDGADVEMSEAEKMERLTAQIRSILEHFKQPDPMGFPGTDVPDPLAVPPMNASFAIAAMSFSNVSVHGLSAFRFHEAKVNVTDMKTEVDARIHTVLIVGNYTLCTWFSCSEGGFTVTLDGVLISGVASLDVGPGGRLRAEEITLDVTFDKISMDFKNLGLMMSMFQGIINKVGSFLFDNVKPLILSEVNANLRNEVNRQVAAVDVRFPCSMAPIDVIISDARRMVRAMGYDPYHLPDVHQKAGLLEASVTHLFAEGVASFYRRGNVSVWMRDHVMHAEVHMATKRLKGSCRWLLEPTVIPDPFFSLFRQSGEATFTAEYLEVRAVFNQSMDTSRHPNLESLDLTLGPLQLVSRGDAGKLNSVSEFGVNVLPNLLRYQIVDALEKPIATRVQAVLDDINLEDIINKHLHEAERKAGLHAD